MGVDLSRFFKKSEFYFYKDRIKEKIDELIAVIDKQELRLQDEVRLKGEEYSKGCHIIEGRLAEYMNPIQEDVAIMLKTRAR